MKAIQDFNFYVYLYLSARFVLKDIIHLNSNIEKCSSEYLNVVTSGARICLGVHFKILTLSQLHEIKQLWYHFTNNDKILIFSGLGKKVHLHELATALSYAQIFLQTDCPAERVKNITHFARFSSLSKLALLVLEYQHLEASTFQPLGY